MLLSAVVRAILLLAIPANVAPGDSAAPYASSSRWRSDPSINFIAQAAADLGSPLLRCESAQEFEGQLDLLASSDRMFEHVDASVHLFLTQMQRPAADQTVKVKGAELATFLERVLPTETAVAEAQLALRYSELVLRLQLTAMEVGRPTFVEALHRKGPLPNVGELMKNDIADPAIPAVVRRGLYAALRADLCALATVHALFSGETLPGWLATRLARTWRRCAEQHWELTLSMANARTPEVVAKATMIGVVPKDCQRCTD